MKGPRKKPGPITFDHKGKHYSIPRELGMTALELYELLDKGGDELARFEVSANTDQD